MKTLTDHIVIAIDDGKAPVDIGVMGLDPDAEPEPFAMYLDIRKYHNSPEGTRIEMPFNEEDYMLARRYYRQHWKRIHQTVRVG